MNVKDYVIQELESYPRTLRQIAVLRYELEHPVQVSTEEMLDAMAFARGEHFGSAPGHVSDKTLCTEIDPELSSYPEATA